MNRPQLTIVLSVLVFPLLALGISWGLTRILIPILSSLGFVDEPRDGHLHTTTVPTCGGVAIIISFLVTCALFLCWNSRASHPLQFVNENTVRLFIPLVILTLCGIYDDRFGISSLGKLFIQVIVASLCWLIGIKFQFLFYYELPAFMSFAITVFWIVSFINAFNLIDGLDGLAAGLAFVSSFCLGIVLLIYGKLPEAVIIFVLAGAALGFLRYNFYPAKIFMGDTGSMVVGFTIAAMGIISSSKSATFASVSVPILAAGVPLFDTFLAVWRRMAKRIINKILGKETGDKVMGRDFFHLHHRLLEMQRDHAKTAHILYFVSFVFAILAIAISLTTGTSRAILFFILFILILGFIRKIAYFEFWTSSQIVIEGLKLPGKRLIIAIAQPFLDLFFLLIALIVSFILSKYSMFYLTGASVISRNLMMLAKDSLLFVFPVFLTLNISRVYRTWWLRASSDDYFYLLEMLFLGSCVSLILAFFFEAEIGVIMLFVNTAVFFLVASVLMLGERFFIRYLNNAYVKKIFQRVHANEETQRVLVYGSGINCNFYLKVSNSHLDAKPVNIIGIVDDDNTLRAQYAYGTKIVGSIDDIEDVYRKKKFDKLVVTVENLPQEKIDYVEAFCDKHNIKLVKASFYEEPYSDH